MSDLTLQVGFVPGVTPDKWARSWRERRGRTRLHLVPQEESEAVAGIRTGALDMALVRLPVERDAENTQAFVGVERARTPRSSRG